MSYIQLYVCHDIQNSGIQEASHVCRNLSGSLENEFHLLCYLLKGRGGGGHSESSGNRQDNLLSHMQL